MKQFYSSPKIIWIFATIILFFVAIQAKAAQPIASADTVSYGYDQAGNRISRGVIVLKSTKVDQPIKYQDNLGKTKITICPNPNGGQFKLSVTGITTKANMKITLYNISGELVYKNFLPPQSIEIDISNQPNGMYILHLVVGNKKKTWKIIKE